MRVVLYSRAGCHLCDVAREALLAERTRVAFDLVEVDVGGDDLLEREYGIRIPVVEIDGEERFEYEVDAAELRSIVQGCELVSADGQSVVWASRLLGHPVPARVAGIDLMQELLGRSERKGLSVYFLGAKDEVLQRAVAGIRERYPELVIAGARDGYFDDSEGQAVADEVRAAKPDILFVAISSPKKEYWLGTHGREIGVPFIMGVGGSIDVMAGITRRAPRPLQRLGLEWAFRLAQEPGRLWRRYLTTNTRFVGLVLAERFRATRS